LKTAEMPSSEIRGTLRFDSKYHLSRHNPLLQDLSKSGLKMVSVAEKFAKEKVWTGNIFARVYASDPTAGKPLLVPYDIFRYVPWSDKVLSRTQVTQFERLQIKRGMLLIVCSGRNLGPVSIADEFCAQFAMSHDMIRIDDDLSDELLYLASFLRTKYGQAVIRTDMNGSVIDHTDAKQILALRYPLLPEDVRVTVIDRFKDGFLKREKARLDLARLKLRHARHFKIDQLSAPFSSKSFHRRFSINLSDLQDRIDAEPSAPQYASYRESLLAGGGCRIDEVANVFRPASRYKTNYVEDNAHGIPLMNGRQISQYQNIALRLMNVAGINKPETFYLRKGMTLLTADGRAEENLADCVMVTDDRAGWGASGHVHRIDPLSLTNPGLLYLACVSEPVQAQLKALATGSVVDALSEADVGGVIVPYEISEEATALGNEATAIWEMFAEASALEANAIGTIERCIKNGGE